MVVGIPWGGRFYHQFSPFYNNSCGGKDVTTGGVRSTRLAGAGAGAVSVRHDSREELRRSVVPPMSQLPC